MARPNPPGTRWWEHFQTLITTIVAGAFALGAALFGTVLSPDHQATTQRVWVSTPGDADRAAVAEMLDAIRSLYAYGRRDLEDVNELLLVVRKNYDFIYPHFSPNDREAIMQSIDSLENCAEAFHSKKWKPICALESLTQESEALEKMVREALYDAPDSSEPSNSDATTATTPASTGETVSPAD